MHRTLYFEKKAANISGCYTGTQARVRERQPLALYFHCIACFKSHNATCRNILSMDSRHFTVDK